MNQVDCLQRADHHFEFYDLPIVTPLDHVDAIYSYAIDLDLKLQYSVVATGDLACVVKRLIEKDMESRSEILHCYRLSDLWCMYNRRMEDHLIREKRLKAFRISVLYELVPVSERVDRHEKPLEFGSRNNA